MKAVPTLYDGIQFRSRLEAKWYAFLKLVGIGVLYEGLDFAGWFPDFVMPLGQDGRRQALMEIKPFNTWEEFRNKGAYRKAINALQKDDDDNISYVVWLGLSPQPSSAFINNHEVKVGQLGWVTVPHNDLWFEGIMTSPAYLVVRDEPSPPSIMWPLFGSADLQLPDGFLVPSFDQLMKLWNEATNINQWKSPVNKNNGNEQPRARL